VLTAPSATGYFSVDRNREMRMRLDLLQVLTSDQTPATIKQEIDNNVQSGLSEYLEKWSEYRGYGHWISGWLEDNENLLFSLLDTQSSDLPVTSDLDDSIRQKIRAATYGRNDSSSGGER